MRLAFGRLKEWRLPAGKSVAAAREERRAEQAIRRAAATANMPASVPPGALLGAMLAVALTADRLFGAALFASCRTLFRR